MKSHDKLPTIFHCKSSNYTFVDDKKKLPKFSFVVGERTTRARCYVPKEWHMIFNKRRTSSQFNVHCCLFLVFFFVFFCLVILGYAFQLPLWLSLLRRSLLLGRLRREKWTRAADDGKGKEGTKGFRLFPFPSSPRPPHAYHFFLF